MTTLPLDARTDSTRPPAPVAAGYAVIGTLGTAIAMIPSYLAGEVFKVGEFAVLLAVAALVSAAVLAVALPRGGSRTAVGLGVAAVLSAAAFWTLLPGSLVLGALVAARAASPGAARVARVLAALAVVCTIAAIAMSL